MHLEVYSKGGALMSASDMEGIQFTVSGNLVVSEHILLQASQYGVLGYFELFESTGTLVCKRPLDLPEIEREAGESYYLKIRVALRGP